MIIAPSRPDANRTRGVDKTSAAISEIAIIFHAVVTTRCSCNAAVLMSSDTLPDMPDAEESQLGLSVNP